MEPRASLLQKKNIVIVKKMSGIFSTYLFYWKEGFIENLIIEQFKDGDIQSIL